MLHGFVEIDVWISLSCYMDFSKLFFVFFTLSQTKPSWRLTKISKLVIWICWSFYLELSNLLGRFLIRCYMELSKLIYGFLKVVIWIFQSCSMCFSPFVKQNQAENWPRIQSLLKLLLDTKRCWTCQSTQCLWSVVPLAMFVCKT